METRRLRYVTRRYAQLQGLRLLPLAAVFLISAMWRAGWVGPHSTTGRTAALWFVAGLTAAVMLSFAIRAWYLKTFGVVSQSTLHSGVIPLVGSLIGFVIAAWLQEQWQWPLSAPAVFLGTVLLGIGVTHGAIRKHYIAVASVWFAVAAFGTFGLSGVARDAVLDVTIALCLIIAGVGDHRLLQRTLQPPREA